MKYDVIMLTGISGFEFQRAIGAYRIASHLRLHNYSVQVIDFIDYFEEDELSEILEKLTGENTLALCVSTTFLKKIMTDRIVASTYKKLRQMSENVKKVIEQYKKKYPSVKIVGGGANISWYKQEDIFDTIITGYGEVIMLEYLDSLKSKKKRIYPKINNTYLINGDQHLLPVETMNHFWQENDCILPGETLPIEISRGCIFNCKFCSYPLNGKKKFDYLRDANLIKEEMIRNYEIFGTTNYMFSDDTFNDTTYKLEKLHKVFTDLPFDLNFVAYIRLDLLYAHKEQIMMLKEMGLGAAGFGIESLKPETAKLIGKGLAKDKVKEFLPKLYYGLWKEEISIICSFIVGLPYESIEEVEESFDWMQSVNINSIWMPLAITPSNFYLSDIDKNYQKYGYELGEEVGYWTSPLMNRKEAEEAAERFSLSASRSGTINSWYLFLMLSYKLNTFDELKKMRWKDLDIEKYRNRKSEMIDEYKKMLKKFTDG
jgi:radical SAM superfamily enzyme YgiQ (UPF0313 family)